MLIAWKKKQGFTIAELLVAMILFGVVSMGSLSLVKYFNKSIFNLNSFLQRNDLRDRIRKNFENIASIDKSARLSLQSGYSVNRQLMACLYGDNDGDHLDCEATRDKEYYPFTLVEAKQQDFVGITAASGEVIGDFSILSGYVAYTEGRKASELSFICKPGDTRTCGKYTEDGSPCTSDSVTPNSKCILDVYTAFRANCPMDKNGNKMLKCPRAESISFYYYIIPHKADVAQDSLKDLFLNLTAKTNSNDLKLVENSHGGDGVVVKLSKIDLPDEQECPTGQSFLGRYGNGEKICGYASQPIDLCKPKPGEKAQQIFKGLDENGNAICEYPFQQSKADNCPAGQVVLGVDPNGKYICGYANKNVSCPDPINEIFVGMSASGTPICKNKKEYELICDGGKVMVMDAQNVPHCQFPMENKSCPAGQVMTGIINTSNGPAPNCVAPQPKNMKSCPENTIVTGFNANGDPTCTKKPDNISCTGKFQYLKSVENGMQCENFLKPEQTFLHICPISIGVSIATKSAEVSGAIACSIATAGLCDLGAKIIETFGGPNYTLENEIQELHKMIYYMGSPNAIPCSCPGDSSMINFTSVASFKCVGLNYLTNFVKTLENSYSQLNKRMDGDIGFGDVSRYVLPHVNYSQSTIELDACSIKILNCAINTLQF